MNSVSFAPTNAATSNLIACTMEYMPVCGLVQVQCFAAPCYPVRETFPNRCTASVAHATNITEGVCEGYPTPIWDPLPPVIGDDRDNHGCIVSAGYSWSESYGKCIRPWEIKRTLLRKEIANTSWAIISLNGKAISNSGTLSFSGNQVSGKLCNTFSGPYKVRGNIIIGPMLMATMRYCDQTDIMPVEDALDLTRVRATIMGDILTLFTRRGDTIIWKRQ